MTTDTQNATAMAYAARENAARRELQAARACVTALVRQVNDAHARADRMAARMARIENYAKRAVARARDEQARLALGDIAVTAAERD